MALTIRDHASTAGRSTLVYEFFDARVIGHLWFVALSDGASVQLMVPTFRSERAARIFEEFIREYPNSALLTIDGQLELARRIEQHLSDQPDTRPAAAKLGEGLPVEERQAESSGVWPPAQNFVYRD